MKPGLYANIHAKRKRIAEGSGEKMNKVGSKAAPSAKDFKEAAKTMHERGGQALTTGVKSDHCSILKARMSRTEWGIQGRARKD